jgi:hypothetical protein
MLLFELFLAIVTPRYRDTRQSGIIGCEYIAALIANTARVFLADNLPPDQLLKTLRLAPRANVAENFVYV